MTLHAGLLRDHIPHALKRIMGIVSRGGAIMAEWMQQHGRENPLTRAGRGARHPGGARCDSSRWATASVPAASPTPAIPRSSASWTRSANWYTAPAHAACR